MNYYELLGVPLHATTDQVKKKYYKFAKLHHPDKGGDECKFKEICEAYETLMDPVKRHQYDIDLSGQTHTFTQADYDIIFKYYNSFIQSVEVRLMMSLFYSVPENVRSKINLKHLFSKTATASTRPSTTIQTTDNIKFIDATQLYDNITLHLKRSLEDVFNRVLKQIIVKTNTTYYHLFITDSDYNIYLYNGKRSTINIELTTLPSHNFYKHGYDLCYLKKIDIYEYYYGATFSIRLPNKFTICCIASQLVKKKTSLLDTFGFYNPTSKKRGTMKIIYQLVHAPVDESNKETLKALFHKKEVFIDPSYPVYEI